MYCSAQDLIDRFGEDELAQRSGRDGTGAMDDQVIALAIADACAEIDGYLTQYSLPMAEVPPVLTRIACDLSRYYLFQNIDLDDNSVVKYRRVSSIEYLRRVARGEVTLGISSTGSAPVENTIVMSISPPRLFARGQ